MAGAVRHEKSGSEAVMTAGLTAPRQARGYEITHQLPAQFPPHTATASQVCHVCCLSLYDLTSDIHAETMHAN